MDPDASDIDVVLDARQITALVHRLAMDIAAAVRGRPLVAVPVLFGAVFFGPDLVRALVARGVAIADVCPVTVASYGTATTSSGAPIVRGLPPRPSIEGHDVLVIDTIVDTGGTIERLEHEFETLGAATVRTVCLLDKRARRTRPVSPTWRGIEAPDRFLVGYGLDAGGRLRGLSCVGSIRERESSPKDGPASDAPGPLDR